MILGFQGKLQGKLGRSRVNSRGKLSPIWSIFCHYVAHKKPHQANAYPLGLLRWHGGLRCPLCVVCNPPPKPYEELNRRLNIIRMELNHGFRIRICESIRIRVHQPHASTSFEYPECSILMSVEASIFLQRSLSVKGFRVLYLWIRQNSGN